MRLSELQSKNIVNMSDGKNIGNIIDVNVLDDGTVDSLIIETGKTIFSFNKEIDKKVLWKEIKKIGEDVILVNIGQNEKG